MNRGFVKLWRKTIDSGLLQNGPALQVFIYLVLRAAHQERKDLVRGSLAPLVPGQAVLSRSQLATELHLGQQQIRTALALLQDMEIITTRATNRYTVITLTNWPRYQVVGKKGNQPGRAPTPNTQPASGYTSFIEEECKNIIPASDMQHYRTRSGRILEGAPLEAFDRFWRAYALPRGKGEAGDAWLHLLDQGEEFTEELMRHICHGARCAAQERGERLARGIKPKWPAGWLADRRWESVAPPEEEEEPPHERDLTEEELAAARIRLTDVKKGWEEHRNTSSSRHRGQPLR